MDNVNPTPTNPPETGTGSVAGQDLMEFVNSLSNEVMTDMVKEPVGKVPTLETSNRLDGVGIKKEQEINANGKEAQQEGSQEASQEASQEVTEETPEVPAETQEPDPLEKRWKDAQSMIGRQANEIGQLRKAVEEMKNQQAPKAEPQAEIPYYEKLAQASEDDIARLLINDAKQKGEELDPYLAKSHARTLKIAAQTKMDIVKDALKPIKQMVEQAKQAEDIAKKDAEWYASHPDFKNRKEAISNFIKEAYPEGLNGDDPYAVAHAAYIYAGKLGLVAKSNADQENNKRIVNARSLNASNKGAVQAGAIQPKQKLNPVQAEAERVWAQIEPSLTQQR